MTLLLACSATGSPGVTTTLVGLALTWPRDVLLADCDRDPAQAVEAGYLRGTAIGGRGLAQVARAHRERRPLAEEVWAQAVTLQHHPLHQRRYLPGFTHPGAPNVFTPVWPDLAGAFRHLEAGGCDVLVDSGRIGREGLPAALLPQVDQVVLVVRSSLRSLAAARLHLPGLLEHLALVSAHAEVGLLVVGPDHPYSVADISAQFRLPVFGTLALDPPSARVLSDGDPEPHRFAEGALMRSCRSLATDLLSRDDARRSQHLAAVGVSGAVGGGRP